MAIGLHWDRPAFHGDSFTVGLYASALANTYRQKLIADMAAAGHGGAPQLVPNLTTALMTTADVVTSAQAEVAAHDPDFVIVAYGINDAFANVADADFQTATDAVLAAYAGRQILVAGIAWCGVNTGDPGDPVYDKALALEAILSARAAAAGAAYSPLLTQTYNHWEYLSNPRIASYASPGYKGD